VGQAEEQLVRDFLKCAEDRSRDVDEMIDRTAEDIVWLISDPGEACRRIRRRA
jgi:hypothetical protein